MLRNQNKKKKSGDFLENFKFYIGHFLQSNFESILNIRKNLAQIPVFPVLFSYSFNYLTKNTFFEGRYFREFDWKIIDILQEKKKLKNYKKYKIKMTFRKKRKKIIQINYHKIKKNIKFSYEILWYSFENNLEITFLLNRKTSYLKISKNLKKKLF